MATEIEDIFKVIESGNHFLLSGGAGSGKTHTLIELLNKIYKDNPKVSIACITFTNVAADEIQDRTNYENLVISTIHDFLWMNISPYQINLKKSLIELNLDDDLNFDEIERIDYREYKNFKKGIIKHEDVLNIAEHLFITYPLLSKIIKDKYDYIFIDEYQDTYKPVIEIFFNHLNKTSKRNVIGLFGDSMQSIYQDGNNLSEYLEDNGNNIPQIIEVQKKINRRNPQSVIDLANNIRLDPLKQNAEINPYAPNNKDGAIKKGRAKFVYSKKRNENAYDKINAKFCIDWNFEDSKDTKLLFLSHSLIANKVGFPSLMNIYDKDKIVGTGGYVERIKNYIKKNSLQDDLIDMSFIEVINTLLKKIDDSLDYKKAITELDRIINHQQDLSYTKCINLLNKKYSEIKEILPTEGIFEFLLNNTSVFDMAKEMNFEDLKNIYLNKDKLIGKKKSKNEESNKRNDERDYLIKHLIRIQEIISLYESKNYFLLINRSDFKINRGVDKTELHERLKKLYLVKGESIKTVIEKANELQLCMIDVNTNDFINKNKFLFERVKIVSFKEIECLYKYIENETVYSTQHGIKGAEFKNVLVFLDKSGNTKLNYKVLFENTTGKESIIERTQKLFYVCCTRAVDDLIIFYNDDYSDEVIEKAIKWFGENNVINIDDL
jgi:DNA helicase-2/ATP-dependent DNA helicase PcrA